MFKSFIKNRKGQVFSEYGLMIVIIVIIAAIAGIFFRDTITNIFTNVKTCSLSVIGANESNCKSAQTGIDAVSGAGTSGVNATGNSQSTTGSTSNSSPLMKTNTSTIDPVECPDGQYLDGNECVDY